MLIKKEHIGDKELNNVIVNFSLDTQFAATFFILPLGENSKH